MKTNKTSDAVLAALVHRHRDSAAHIADDVGCSVSTARKYLEMLVREGRAQKVWEECVERVDNLRMERNRAHYVAL